MTAVGWALVIATMVVTGLVVANWGGRESNKKTVGGGTLYGLNENKKHDESYRNAYAACIALVRLQPGKGDRAGDEEPHTLEFQAVWAENFVRRGGHRQSKTPKPLRCFTALAPLSEAYTYIRSIEIPA